MKRLWRGRVTTQHACLDAGCGGGTYAIEHFLKCGANCFLVDLSDTNVIMARRQVEEAGRATQGTFFQGPLEELPREIGPFDRIQCLEVLEHLEDPASILKTLHALSSPECLLMVSVPHPPEWFPNSSHVKEGYTETELRDLLKSTGWEVIEVCLCMLILSRVMKWLNVRIVPPHGFNFLLILERWVPQSLRSKLLPADIIALAKRIPQNPSPPGIQSTHAFPENESSITI